MLFFDLGALVVKTILRCKLNGSVKLDVSMDLLEIAEKIGFEEYHKRDFKRSFEKMADDIAHFCDVSLQMTQLTEDQKEVVGNAIKQSVNSVAWTDSLLFEIKKDTNSVKKLILDNNKDITDGFSQAELSIYHSFIQNISEIIVEYYSQLPTFEKERQEKILATIDENYELTKKVLDNLYRIDEKVESRPDKYRNYEREYRKSILSIYDKVQLFGADIVGEKLKKYRLSTAYVELEVDMRSSHMQIKTSELFGYGKNIWLSGEAGSGKTTCLYWLAIKTANNEFVDGLEEAIPLVIELRKHDIMNINIPDCLNKTMQDSTYTIPDGWFENAVDNGKILFLIDGADEITEDERNHVFEWIEKIDSKNKCYKLFTSRPQIKSRPSIKGIVEVKLLPMGQRQVEEFIKYWYQAVYVEKLGFTKNEIRPSQNTLLETLDQNEPLRRLASNPLLCAMIAALHTNSGEAIPTSKRDLYEACCSMLLDKRDTERRIKGKVRLPYEKKKLVLAKLACNMMRNNNVDFTETTRGNVTAILKTTMEDMGITDITPEKFLNYLVERTGLLQEPENNKISFIHRSFQEYLCAFELSRQNEWGYLETKLLEDTWVETISMAIGFAHKEEANSIITETLNQSNLKKEKRYFFFALEYFSGALEIDAHIRDRISKMVSEYIPPTKDEVDQIAKAGAIAIPYLKYKPEYNKCGRKCCIKALKGIRTIESLKAALCYLNKSTTEDELVEIANFIGLFSTTALKDNNIPHIVAKYYSIVLKQNELFVIPAEMIRVFNIMNQLDYDLISKYYPSKLKILGYYDDLEYASQIDEDDYNDAYDALYDYDDYDESKTCEGEDDDSMFSTLPAELCDKTRILEISGMFQEARILRNFNNLKSLKIINTKRKYSPSELEQYDVSKGVEELYIKCLDSNIVAKDLMEFTSCSKLTLELFGVNTELDLDRFGELEELKELTVISPYALEFDYTHLSSLDKVKICYPTDQRGSAFLIQDEINCKNVEFKTMPMSYRKQIRNY